MSDQESQQNSDNLTFTQAFRRLEEIADALEKPDIELEEAEKLVEEAKKLESFCRERLEEQKVTISQLFSGKEDGNIADEGEEDSSVDAADTA